MNQNILPSEIFTPICAISPQVINVATDTSTAFFDIQHFQSFLAVFSIGVGNASLLRFKVLQGKFNPFASKDIPGKVSAYYAGGLSYAGKHVLINFNAKDLDADGGFRMVALNVSTGSTLNGIFSGMLFGYNARHRPNLQLSSIESIIV